MSLCQKHEICSGHISADPICPFPTLALRARGVNSAAWAVVASCRRKVVCFWMQEKTTNNISMVSKSMCD